MKTSQHHHTNNNKKSIATKTVRFHNTTMVKKILHANNFTDDEINSCWYSRKEDMNIQNGLFMTLDLMKLSNNSSSGNTNSNNNNSNYNSNDTLLCTRGLEDLSSDKKGLKLSTQMRRLNALMAVLKEQDVQYQYDNDEGITDINTMMIYDDVKIRDVYRNHSRVSENIAYSIGLIDSFSRI